MKAALLLVDLQYDFLNRPGLTPPAAALIGEVSRLLEACRSGGIPVIHAHSVYSTDGSDRMPHWKRDDYRACVEGTHGAATPPELAPVSGENIIVKKFFSAFSNPELKTVLDQHAVDTLIVAGVYSHACVRSAVLDAYQNDLTVWVADEAVGGIDSLMSDTSRSFIEGRAASYLSTGEILRRLGIVTVPTEDRDRGEQLPVAYIRGQWIEAEGRQHYLHLDPCDCETVLSNIAIGTQEDAEDAANCARDGASIMAAMPETERAGILERCGRELERRREELVRLICRETGKALTDAKEEFDRSLSFVQVARRLLEEDVAGDIHIDTHARVRRRPVGVIAVLSPWNNPLALPLGKIAPALACGNSLVWKPALEASRTAMAVIECLESAGVPAGAVNLVFGNAATAHKLITRDAVAAVTLTGSINTGRLVAVECGNRLIPLQAELGGNNAALVMPSCDLDVSARHLAELAFSFSGQRCTALRRIIVEDSIAEAFTAVFSAAIKALPIGLPGEPDTRITPLISPRHRQRVAATVEAALREGAKLISGGRIPPSYDKGCWYEPTVLQVDNRHTHLFQNETFGPVAVLHTVPDFEEAIQACNAVSQGLLAALYSEDTAQQTEFLNRAEAGMLRINPDSGAIHPEAPFGGWKASGYGTPEHGIWDLNFYTRPQTIYD